MQNEKRKRETGNRFLRRPENDAFFILHFELHDILHFAFDFLASLASWWFRLSTKASRAWNRFN
jgi:hypothetical protein